MRSSHLLWNLLGLGVPVCAAVAAVPVLVANLGPERFGLLALAWAIVGMATTLDLGIGRAVTKIVASWAREDPRVGAVLHTAVIVTALSGLLVMGLLLVAAALGWPASLPVSHVPRDEIISATALIALALPAQAMTATYRGLNEARLQFAGVNALRAAQGVVSFVGPAVVSMFTSRLEALIVLLVLGRWLGLVISRTLARQCLSGREREGARFSSGEARALFAFGGWVTLSSLMSPLFLQADRFLIGALVSMGAVTAYVLPYELVVQALVVVGAFSSVFFPNLSALLARPEGAWRAYFWRWSLRLGLGMALGLSVVALALPQLLHLWLGDEVPAESVTVGRVLCLGVFMNAVGSMFFALLHARGRPDLTAKAHMIELPVFLALLYLAVVEHGIEGAAWAWTLRMVLDAGLLALASWRADRSPPLHRPAAGA